MSEFPTKQGKEDSLEDVEQKLKKQLTELIDFIRKANENVEAVNLYGRGIVHEAIGLGGMRKKISEFTQAFEAQTTDELATLGDQKKAVVSLLQEIAAQDLRTGYDSDVIKANIDELKKIYDLLADD